MFTRPLFGAAALPAREHSLARSVGRPAAVAAPLPLSRAVAGEGLVGIAPGGGSYAVAVVAVVARVVVVVVASAGSYDGRTGTLVGSARRRGGRRGRGRGGRNAEFSSSLEALRAAMRRTRRRLMRIPFSFARGRVAREEEARKRQHRLR